MPTTKTKKISSKSELKRLATLDPVAMAERLAKAKKDNSALRKRIILLRKALFLYANIGSRDFGLLSGPAEDALFDDAVKASKETK